MIFKYLLLLRSKGDVSHISTDLNLSCDSIYLSVLSSDPHSSSISATSGPVSGHVMVWTDVLGAMGNLLAINTIVPNKYAVCAYGS